MPEKIRLFELIGSLAVEGPGGGIGRFGIDLCKNLSPDQFDVWLIALWDFGAESEKNRIKELNALGLKTLVAARWEEKNPYRSFWKAFFFIRKLCRQYRPHIIHSHSEFGDILALFLKLLAPSLLLMRTVHYGFQREWRKRPLRRLILTNLSYPIFFKLEIGVAPWIAENINGRKLVKWLKRTARYLPNAIELSRFNSTTDNRDDKKTSLSIPLDVPVVGTIGRLTEQKGYQYLIRAAHIVIQKIPKTFFLIVGDGEEFLSLKILAEKLGIASQVILLGPRQDIEDILPCFDLFVSSSLWEGLPTVILEGIAAGVPIVGTDIQGTNDIIQHQTTGWLVPAGNANLLAKGILELLTNLILRENLAKEAKKILSFFSIGEITRQYEECYKDIAGKLVKLN